MSVTAPPFSLIVHKLAEAHGLALQPRMGFGGIDQMRNGLLAIRDSGAPVLGTITVDSYTRTGQDLSIHSVVRNPEMLNGFPITTYSQSETSALVNSTQTSSFAIQVRHGTPLPSAIFRSTVGAGLRASEGGPISYCLPYGSISVEQSIESWQSNCRTLSTIREPHFHMETFGGCLLGQLCHPALLLAVSLLEAIFFSRSELRSVSLSYTQGLSALQDIAALRTLKTLAAHYLPELDWHIVFYTYMGVFPRSAKATELLIRDSALVAYLGGAERLVVKTSAEATRIPTIQDNVQALRLASDVIHLERDSRYYTSLLSNYHAAIDQEVSELDADARSILDCILDSHPKIALATAHAIHNGWVDVPHCLHPDNAKRCMTFINGRGFLDWATIGDVPLSIKTRRRLLRRRSLSRLISSDSLLHDLSVMQRRYERAARRSVSSAILDELAV